MDNGQSRPIETPNDGGERGTAPMVIGLLFWVIIIGVGLFFYIHEEHADVFIDAVGAPLAVQGRVVYQGVSAEGVAQVRVTDALSRQLIQSATLEVKGGVLPSMAIPLAALSAKTEKPALRIDIEFRGTARPRQGKEPVEARGENTLFLNVPPPLSRRAVYWSIGATTAFGAVMTFLITGFMGPAKARLLFAFMYLATLLALAVPIAASVWVAQNPYLRKMMEEAPVGIVLALGEGATKPQWLINIGGTVLAGNPVEGLGLPASDNQASREAVTGNASAKDVKPVGAKTANGTSPDTTAKSSASENEASQQAVTGNASAKDVKSAGAKTINAVSRDTAANSPERDSGRRVVGGLTVPFFVVMLAMFGAAVNLTRKVPAIQREYYQFLGKAQPSFVVATGAALLGSVFRERSESEPEWAADVREKLVQNIMYFAAAPFLGIAVYYLLRVLATEVTQPALVIASFATGLVSDKIVTKIIGFAEKLFEAQAQILSEELTIASISPPSGGGGTQVTIVGSGFATGASVEFGGREATNVKVGTTSIVADTPDHTPGSVDVRVTSASGRSSTLTNGFTYVQKPSITSISPQSGSSAGSELVLISGNGLSGVTQVAFGDTPATDVKVASDGKIEATTPAHVSGAVDVAVHAGPTSAVLRSAYTYT